jgi:hypothetical protein
VGVHRGSRGFEITGKRQGVNRCALAVDRTIERGRVRETQHLGIIKEPSPMDLDRSPINYVG